MVTGRVFVSYRKMWVPGIGPLIPGSVGPGFGEKLELSVTRKSRTCDGLDLIS